MMKFGEREVRESGELEMRGVLQKRNRNGMFQNRYFSTRGAFIEYWSSSEEAIASPQKPSSSYDMREIKVVEGLGDRIVYIQFMNEKFKLELRAISEEQCQEWINFLRAKISLHSPNNLLSDIDDGVRFQTKTFATLLRLKPGDQDRWINDSLNESFEVLYDECPGQIDPRKLIEACKTCLDELALTCDECALEMTGRRPQITAQCRDYMQRYCDLFRSRLTLELSGYFSISLAQVDLIGLGDECLIEAIRFFQTFDSLKNHKFLPRSLFSGVRENLVGADQLTKAFLKVLIDRNDTWFSELYELQPRQRGNKLSDYHRIVDYQIQKIHDTFYVSDLYDVKSKQILLLSAVDTLAMNIAKHVANTSFADYGEEALLGHILACQENVRYFSQLRVYPHSGCKISAKSNLDSITMDESKDKWVMALSRVCIEQVGESFLRSAHEAATAAVLNVSQTSTDIVNLLFVETGGWIGGKVVHAYLDRVTGWMEAFCQRGASKPCEFHRIIRRETIRLVVVTYIRKLIDKYRLNKRFKLSADGETQVANDLQIIGRWVEQNNEKLIPSYVTDRGSYTGSNDVTMLIRNARLFMTSDESNILLCFVESIQHFGLACAPHLYDLARLALKIRSDLSKKARLSTLGSFGCYITKLTAATIEGFGPLSHPHPRISGPSILQELFPNTGATHCTGKKWSYEKLNDPDGHLNLEISTLVTDACSVARIRRAAYRDSSTTLHATSHASNTPGDLTTSSSTLTQSSDAGESSDTWQLLDPDHLRMEHGPLDAERPSLQAITEERDRMMMAAAAISLLDAAEFSTDPSERYAADSLKPFVDLYGCTFAEMHLSLRPPMYSDSTFTITTLRVPARTMSSAMMIDTAAVLSDEDTVSEDEFSGFDGDYDESLPLSGGHNYTSESKEDVIGVAASAVEVGMSQLPLHKDDEERMGIVASEVALSEPEAKPMLPPAKPPKPRRYSKCNDYEPSSSPEVGGSRAISSESSCSDNRVQCEDLAEQLTNTLRDDSDESNS